MAEIQKIGRVTFRELTNEESLQRYGSSFVFVGSRPDSLEQEPKAAGDRAVKRLAGERRRGGHGGDGHKHGTAGHVLRFVPCELRFRGHAD